ncbi:MAG: hypothetical protein ACYC4E_00995 [Carboxydocellales bacterium]
MSREFLYTIPKNMNHNDKVWSNGQMYLTWSDVSIIMASLFIAMLISLLNLAVYWVISLVVLTIGTGLFLALLKPLGYNLFHYLSMLIAYQAQPSLWVWRRTKL